MLVDLRSERSYYVLGGTIVIPDGYLRDFFSIVMGNCVVIAASILGKSVLLFSCL